MKHLQSNTGAGAELKMQTIRIPSRLFFDERKLIERIYKAINYIIIQEKILFLFPRILDTELIAWTMESVLRDKRRKRLLRKAKKIIVGRFDVCENQMIIESSGCYKINSGAFSIPRVVLLDRKNIYTASEEYFKIFIKLED